MNQYQKKYPMDGPPKYIQQIRMNPNRTAEELQTLRWWVDDYRSKNGRKETIEAYDI
jgi:hypothetical protein